jgi:hypothetical protein
MGSQVLNISESFKSSPKFMIFYIEKAVLLICQRFFVNEVAFQIANFGILASLKYFSHQIGTGEKAFAMLFFLKL